MDNKSYPIPFPGQLLTPEHRQAISSAIWEYLFLVDKVTNDVVKGGCRFGQVLGGKTIQSEQIAAALGSHVQTVRKNLRSLEDKGYIIIDRQYDGIQVQLPHSVKWQGRDAKRTTYTGSPLHCRYLAVVPGLFGDSKESHMCTKSGGECSGACDQFKPQLSAVR